MRNGMYPDRPGATMTMSQRERRLLAAIEAELSQDATLTRLASLFTGPIMTPPDVWLSTRRPGNGRPGYSSS